MMTKKKECHIYNITRKLARSKNGKIQYFYSRFIALCHSKQNFSHGKVLVALPVLKKSIFSNIV
jgi:hypothetical protein